MSNSAFTFIMDEHGRPLFAGCETAPVRVCAEQTRAARAEQPRRILQGTIRGGLDNEDYDSRLAAWIESFTAKP